MKNVFIPLKGNMATILKTGVKFLGALTVVNVAGNLMSNFLSILSIVPGGKAIFLVVLTVFSLFMQVLTKIMTRNFARTIKFREFFNFSDCWSFTKNNALKLVVLFLYELLLVVIAIVAASLVGIPAYFVFGTTINPGLADVNAFINQITRFFIGFLPAISLLMPIISLIETDLVSRVYNPTRPVLSRAI